jgi:hypothetical protein
VIFLVTTYGIKSEVVAGCRFRDCGCYFI